MEVVTMIYELNIASSVLAFVFCVISLFCSTDLAIDNNAWIAPIEPREEDYYYHDRFNEKGSFSGDCFAENTCGRCTLFRNTAKNFLFAASGCAFFVVVASVYLSKYRSSTLQWINFLMAFAAISFSAAGQRLFIDGCLDLTEPRTLRNAHNGPGTIISFIGNAMMWMVLFSQGIVCLADYFALRPEDGTHPAIRFVVSPAGHIVLDVNWEYYFRHRQLPGVPDKEPAE